MSQDHIHGACMDITGFVLPFSQTTLCTPEVAQNKGLLQQLAQAMAEHDWFRSSNMRSMIKTQMKTMGYENLSLSPIPVQERDAKSGEHRNNFQLYATPQRHLIVGTSKCGRYEVGFQLSLHFDLSYSLYYFNRVVMINSIYSVKDLERNEPISIENLPEVVVTPFLRSGPSVMEPLFIEVLTQFWEQTREGHQDHASKGLLHLDIGRSSAISINLARNIFRYSEVAREEQFRLSKIYKQLQEEGETELSKAFERFLVNAYWMCEGEEPSLDYAHPENPKIDLDHFMQRSKERWQAFLDTPRANRYLGVFHRIFFGNSSGYQVMKTMEVGFDLTYSVQVEVPPDPTEAYSRSMRWGIGYVATPIGRHYKMFLKMGDRGEDQVRLIQQAQAEMELCPSLWSVHIAQRNLETQMGQSLERIGGLSWLSSGSIAISDALRVRKEMDELDRIWEGVTEKMGCGACCCTA